MEEDRKREVNPAARHDPPAPPPPREAARREEPAEPVPEPAQGEPLDPLGPGGIGS